MKKVSQYDHAKIEKKWQKEWAKKKVYATSDPSKAKGKKKFYVLDMFPYPSGEGLHVGHPKGYIATDIVSRMKRMQGYNVLHPMGFDAFGLPAEQYAIKMKTNPAVAVGKNVARYKKQLEILGLDYDWSREVNTTDPKFYKWTQWIFLKMFEKGLAYESYEPINWCPSCKTGLANEDLEDGKCERCGTPVEKKPMRQWVLKITDYADRLLNDLDATDYVIPHVVDHVNPPRKDKKDVVRKNVHAIVYDPKNKKYLILKNATHGWNTVVIGGIEAGEDAIQAARREVEEETGYVDLEFKRILGGEVKASYFAKHKDVNRVAYSTAVYFELRSDKQVAVATDGENDGNEITWIDADQFIPGFMVNSELSHWLERIQDPTKGWGTPLLDWPESIKEAQRNWIGRSEGAEFDFKIKNLEEKITVFTTRADTIFGVTYVVLAPEHELVSKFNIQNKKEVDAYVEKAKAKTVIERTDAKKEKTGVELKGITAINPVNGEEVPVWVADYVLGDYGTGAVMAVPAHDERDYEFAQKYNLPMQQVIVEVKKDYTSLCKPRENKNTITRSSVVCVVKHWSKDEYLCLNWRKTNWHTPITGGIDEGETAEIAGMREIREESGFKNVTFIGKGLDIIGHYYHPIKDINRFEKQTPLFFTLVDDEQEALSDEENAKHELIWIKKSEVEAYLNHDPENYDASVALHVWSQFNKAQAVIKEGILINSSDFNTLSSAAAKKEITEKFGRKVVKYKLKDWVFSRQRYWGEPMPLLHRPDGTVVAVPEKELPVTLPMVKSYEPTGTGESPLAAITKWVNVKKGKEIWKRETNTMPQWAGSSWYYLRYMDPKNTKAIVDAKKEKYWNQTDLYVGGAEHATRHLIYARFWHKFLYDIGVVSTIEPFHKLQNVGLIMAEDGRKMSKRWGNVVNPDDIIATYGADTMRLYEMFMGPFDQAIAWNTQSMIGTRRFIERIWNMQEKVQGKKNANKHTYAIPADLETLLNQTIKKVTEDIEHLAFNTAISAMMILLNRIEKESEVSREMYMTLLRLLAPFAPHMTDEIWSVHGGKGSIHKAPWPTYDVNKLEMDTVTIAVQVNGKVRGSISCSRTLDKAAIVAAAVSEPHVAKWLEGKTIKKEIYVPGKLVSIVVD